MVWGVMALSFKGEMGMLKFFSGKYKTLFASRLTGTENRWVKTLAGFTALNFFLMNLAAAAAPGLPVLRSPTLERMPIISSNESVAALEQTALDAGTNIARAKSAMQSHCHRFALDIMKIRLFNTSNLIKFRHVFRQKLSRRFQPYR